MDSYYEPVDTEMTPMRHAVRNREVELGVGAAKGCFRCKAFHTRCNPSIVEENGETNPVRGGWTYVGQRYGKAMIEGKRAKILFVAMERPFTQDGTNDYEDRYEDFEETQYQFRTACYSRTNPHMGGTDVELECLLDPTAPKQRCLQFALTNSVRCRLPSTESKSTQTMIDNCRDHTKAIIETLTPDIIVTQGIGFPSEGIVEMFESRIIFESDNGRRGRSYRYAEVRRGQGILFLLTAHPARNPGFGYKNGYLPDYLRDAINEMRDLYAADGSG